MRAVPHASASELDPPTGDVGFRRRVERFPFVPADRERLEQDCYEAYNIQVSGLTQRLRATGIKRVVIGVSGGLDSTQALIVCAQAFDLLQLPRARHPRLHHAGLRHHRSYQGQCLAADAVRSASRPRNSTSVPPPTRMLADIGHPYANGQPVYDLTFENVQAGLRTDYLFRLANHHDGIVIGTGDLSELALGWCTYGVGDQMAHYNVNAGVPKTLIQHLIRWVISSRQFAPAVLETLDAILATEISPELIPAEEGEAPQSTEASIGPYALQDFTLYYTLRHGFCAVEDRVPGVAGMGGRSARRLAAAFSAGAPRGLRPAADPALAGGVPAPLLRVQPVQAQRHAERPEGQRRRLAVAPRRLARAVGRQRERLAGGVGAQCPKGIASTCQCKLAVRLTDRARSG